MKNKVIQIPTVAVIAILVYHSHGDSKHVAALQPNQCGGRLTSPCLADSDPKYNDDFPSSILGQDERWKKFEGLWMETVNLFNSTYDPDQPTPYIIGRGIPYAKDSVKAFHNHTIKGSRLIVNRYYVYRPAPTSFCEATSPTKNVIGKGTCGVNGHAKVAGQYGSSTHENNGNVDMIRTVGAYSPLPYGKPYDLNPPGRFAWVDENTLRGTNAEKGIFSQNNGYVFTGSNSAAVNTNSFSLIMNHMTIATTGNMIRIDDENQWVDNLNKAFDEYNVLYDDRFDPRIANAVSYPTEEEWCGGLTNDPSCTASPYQEPNSNLNSGAKAGFIILGVAVFAIVGYMLHHHRMKEKKSRCRKRFIRNVARNITITPTPGALSQHTLLKEFNHIDKDKNGTIEKKELKIWMADGKLGAISDSDFNILWAAMDIDNSGSVDFIEFCTFLSSCGEAFDEVYEEQINMTHEERKSLACRRLSQIAVHPGGPDEDGCQETFPPLRGGRGANHGHKTLARTQASAVVPGSYCEGPEAFPDTLSPIPGDEYFGAEDKDD